MVSMDPYFVVSRIGGVLASIVGVLGLLLACMGVYGMVNYSVAQRTREIGIRMALGADDVRVLELVVRQGFQPIAAGILAGIGASAAIYARREGIDLAKGARVAQTVCRADL